MSGGYFNYRTDEIIDRLFGYRVSPVYGMGDEKFYKKILTQNGCEHYSVSRRKEYLDNLKMVRKKDPFDNLVISELVYDVFCLLHSYDYVESGDVCEEQFADDINAFAEKWLGKKPTFKKDIVDAKLEQTKEEIYKAVGL